jgi:arabinan endo-1,5-alpha-L-arabinosidase
MLTEDCKSAINTLITLTAFSMPAAPAWAQSGDVRRVHDPCIIKNENTYYLFSTGTGIPIRQSTDLIESKLVGPTFKQMPAWTFQEVPRFRGYAWAPDISFFDGKYRLYYSVSTFGSRRSCIGLATNTTLDPQSKSYQWVDEGKVIESRESDRWNAIDPNVVIDEDGTPPLG